MKLALLPPCNLPLIECQTLSFDGCANATLERERKRSPIVPLPRNKRILDALGLSGITNESNRAIPITKRVIVTLKTESGGGQRFPTLKPADR